jgi:hypothetical protein
MPPLAAINLLPKTGLTSHLNRPGIGFGAVNARRLPLEWAKEANIASDDLIFKSRFVRSIWDEDFTTGSQHHEDWPAVSLCTKYVCRRGLHYQSMCIGLIWLLGHSV